MTYPYSSNLSTGGRHQAKIQQTGSEPPNRNLPELLVIHTSHIYTLFRNRRHNYVRTHCTGDVVLQRQIRVVSCVSCRSRCSMTPLLHAGCPSGNRKQDTHIKAGLQGGRQQVPGAVRKSSSTYRVTLTAIDCVPVSNRKQKPILFFSAHPRR